MPDTNITSKFSADVSSFKKGITEANKAIKLANAEFKAASAGMDDWSKSTNGIQAKIKQLQSVMNAQTSKLKNYQSQLAEIQATEKKNADQADKLRAKLKELADSGVSKTSAEYKKYENALKQVENEQEKNKNAADKLKVTILNQKGAVDGIAKDMRNYKQSLDQVENESNKANSSTKKMNQTLNSTDKAAKKAKDGFTVMKAAAGNLIANGITRLASAITDQLGAAVERVDTINQYKRTMENLGYSTKDVAETTDELKKGIDGLPTTLPAIMSQQQQYAALSGDISQATKLTVALNDATLAGGQGQEKATRAMQAWYKIIAAGKPTQQRWMIINSSMPAQMNQIASSVLGAGKKSQDLFEAWKSGKVKTEQITKALIELDKKGGGGMASFKKQAGGATKGINTSITNIKTSITNLLADIIESIGSKNIATFFANMKEAVNSAKPQIVDFFKKFAIGLSELLKNKNTLTNLATGVKLLIAAFAISKVLSFTSAISGMITSLIAAATATEGATVATNLFNAAWAANPVGMVTMAIGLLAGAIWKLVDATKASNTTEAAALKKADVEVEKYNALKKTISENSKARQDNAKDASAEGVQIDFLYKKLNNLLGVEHKSTAQKKQIKEIVKELNELVPHLGLKYDEEKDKLNKNTKSISKNIEARKRQLLIDAMLENSKGIAKDIAKTEVEKNNLIERGIALQKERQKQQKKYDDYYKKYKNATNATDKEYYSDLLTAAQTDLDQVDEKIKKNKKSVADAGKTIKKLKKDYDDSFKVAEGQERANAFDKLASKAKKAGVDIPKALKSGMLNGLYEIPSSVKALNSTIKFDAAIKKAGIDAKKIPSSIKNGITSGKTSVKAGVAQANRWVDFTKAQKNAKLDGAKIPKFLRNQIINGKVSAKKAVSSLSSVVKFTKAVDKANKDGKDVPKSLVKGVNSGKTSVKSANKQLNNWIEFKDAAKKAGVDSKNIPKKMRQGILSGKTSVKSAVKTLASQTKNSGESNKNGSSTGKAYTSGMVKGLKSGKGEVYRAAKEVGKSAHKGAKDGVHSKSPSKDGIKLGEDYDKGVEIGLVNGTHLVSMAGRKLGAGLHKSVKKVITGSAISNIKKTLLSEIKKGNITDAAINNFDKSVDKGVKRVKKSIKKKITNLVKDSIHDHSKKQKSKIKSAGSMMMSAFSSGLTKEANKLKSKANKVISKITEEFNNAYNNLIEKASSLQSNLNSMDLFVTDPHGDTYLGDIKGYNQKLSQVGANLSKIKNLGFSNNLLDEIAAMDTETQLAFTNKLLALTPAEQKAFNAEYVKKEKLAKSISDDFYSKRIADLKANYSNKVTAEINKLKKDLNKASKNAVDGLIKGLKDKKRKKKLKGAAADLAKDIVQAVKKNLKIASPSRVLEGLGIQVPAGLGKGIIKNTSAAVMAVNRMVSRVVSAGQSLTSGFGLSGAAVRGSMAVNRPAWATGYGSSTNNSNVSNVTFNQTINSPSPVSALENYRNTKNALNQLKRELK